VTIARITLLGKPGCHLCDDARAVVNDVVAGLAGDAGAPDVTVEEFSILDDDALLAQYAEEIPVVLINDRVHNYWRIDPDRLRKALLAAGAGA
jgi:glutaredoxin